MKNFLKNALPRSVQLLFFWVSVSIMSDVFNIQGLKCGYRTKIKVVVEKFFGRPSEESWLSRLSLRVKVEWGELQHLDTIPSWLQLHPLFLCLPSSDKVWADLSHRMFTRGIQCQRLSISIQKNPQNATDLQMCKYTATLTCFVENSKTTYP